MALIMGASAWPSMARAEERRRTPKVGILWHAANPEGEVPYFGSLLDGFAQLGYTEGKIELIHRFPDEKPERIQEHGGRAGRAFTRRARRRRRCGALCQAGHLHHPDGVHVCRRSDRGEARRDHPPPRRQRHGAHELRARACGQAARISEGDHSAAFESRDAASIRPIRSPPSTPRNPTRPLPSSD